MKNLIYICFLLAFLSSCVETIEPRLDEAYVSELVVNSVVVPGEPVKFFLSTSVPIDSDLVPFRPVNGQAEVYLQDQGGEVVVEYDDEEELWSTSRVYNPRPGYVFELSVELTDSRVAPVTSATFVPVPVSILEFQNTTTSAPNGVNYTLNLDIESSDEDIHYRLIARDVNTGLEIPVLNVSKGSEAVTRLAQMDGIMINSSALTNGEFEYTIQSDVDLSQVKLDLYTVNDEYYRYNVSLSNAYGSNNSPFDEPVARYSNIDSGLGLFGSYSVFSKVYDLK